MYEDNFTKGFTIFEVLIVIGISTLLIALTAPMGFRFYQVQVADETTVGVLSALQSATREARLGKNDHAFGIKFLSDRYVIFEGDQYTARIPAQDQTYALPLGTSIGSTTDEIVFAKVTGIPSATGTFSIGLYGVTHMIAVNSFGMATQTN